MLLAEVVFFALAVFGTLALLLLLAFIVALIVISKLRRSLNSAPSVTAADLEAVRRQQQETLNELRERIADVQSAKARAEAERARLLQGLNEITGGGGDGVTVAIANAKELAEHAHALEAHESEMAGHDHELDELQTELGAAEELLREVDTQRGALEGQLKDRDKELWRLRSEIEGMQRRSHEQRSRTVMLTRSNVKKTDVVAGRLEDQLKHWVKNTGEANVNFSEHGHASMVREFFGKLDRDFINRYFSHVTNPEYERGKHRTIHVHDGKDPDGTEYGELRVALDDDAGRTLGLRFDLKGTAHDAKSVGFVLAMYLRAINRELRDFDVHTH